MDHLLRVPGLAPALASSSLLETLVALGLLRVQAEMLMGPAVPGPPPRLSAL